MLRDAAASTAKRRSFFINTEGDGERDKERERERENERKTERGRKLKGGIKRS